MLAVSENPDKILDNIPSPADVDHLIAERIEYANSQKVEKEYLTQDPVNAVSEFVEGKVDRCYVETTIIRNSGFGTYRRQTKRQPTKCRLVITPTG